MAGCAVCERMDCRIKAEKELSAFLKIWDKKRIAVRSRTVIRFGRIINTLPGHQYQRLQLFLYALYPV